MTWCGFRLNLCTDWAYTPDGRKHRPMVRDSRRDGGMVGLFGLDFDTHVPGWKAQPFKRSIWATGECEKDSLSAFLPQLEAHMRWRFHEDFCEPGPMRPISEKLADNVKSSSPAHVMATTFAAEPVDE